MIHSFFAIDNEETGIDWLDAAIKLANILILQIILDGRLAESGKALLLKSSDAKSDVGSNPTSSSITEE